MYLFDSTYMTAGSPQTKNESNTLDFPQLVGNLGYKFTGDLNCKMAILIIKDCDR
jgi:hypothetical protein